MVPSIYEWAGGAEAFERLTELLYRKVHQDPLLAPIFANVVPDHAHHLDLAITEPQRRRWVQLITESADDAGLPADPEFRLALIAYLEWGSRIGMANSHTGAEPPPEAPVPRWGWGEAPPMADPPAE
jgi:hemoglobin